MRIIRDCIASEMIPLRLIISVTLIAMISFFTIQGFIQYTHMKQEETFIDSLSIIQKNIEAMVLSGHPRDISNIHSPQGSTQIHEITIPSIIQGLTFGLNEPSEIGEDGMYQLNAITFTSQHSGKQILWCDDECLFIKGVHNATTDTWIPEGSNPSFHVSGTGTYRIIFELVEDRSSVFILVYGQIT